MMPRKIMIVDDDKEFLEELNEILLLSGYEVIAVNEAESVLETAVKTKPDLILMDLKMPVKTGFQIADELRHFTELSHIPVLAMSGFFTKKEHQLLMKICGIKKCLKKPFNPLDVITQIEKILD